MATKRIPISFAIEYEAEYKAVKDKTNRSAWICEAIREKLEREASKISLEDEVRKLKERVELLESRVVTAPAKEVGSVPLDSEKNSKLKEKRKNLLDIDD